MDRNRFWSTVFAVATILLLVFMGYMIRHFIGVHYVERKLHEQINALEQEPDVISALELTIESMAAEIEAVRVDREWGKQ